MIPQNLTNQFLQNAVLQLLIFFFTILKCFTHLSLPYFRNSLPTEHSTISFVKSHYKHTITVDSWLKIVQTTVALQIHQIRNIRDKTNNLHLKNITFI